jgi:hypothetical protein
MSVTRLLPLISNYSDVIRIAHCSILKPSCKLWIDNTWILTGTSPTNRIRTWHTSHHRQHTVWQKKKKTSITCMQFESFCYFKRLLHSGAALIIECLRYPRDISHGEVTTACWVRCLHCLWEKKGLFRSTPAVAHNLSFCDLIRRIA